MLNSRINYLLQIKECLIMNRESELEIDELKEDEVFGAVST